jgi:hypothetical protein
MKKYLENALNHQQRLLPIIIIALFLIISKIGFVNSKYVVLFGIIVKILLFLSALFIPGFFFLKLIKKNYFDNNTAFLLAAPTSITLFGVIFIVLQLFKSPPLWYWVFNIAVTALIILLAYKSKIIKEILCIDNTLKYSLILIIIGAVMATSYVAVNTDNPTQEVNTWTIPANRGLYSPLPVDNNLQYDTAMVFANYRPPWSWGANNWTMGDRPPLLGVVNAIVALSLATPSEWLFNLKPISYPFWYYEIIGIVLNLLFILPLTFLANQVFSDKKAIYFVPLAVLLNGFIFLNIYFTWPKLLAAYFALLAIALLFSRPINGVNAFIVGWLWALAALSHGGAVLSLPVLLVFYSIYLLRKIKLTVYLKYLMIFTTAFVIWQSPWSIYKKMHPTIDTVQLYFFYIPTKYWPSEGISFASKNTIPALMKFLQATPLEKQLSVRWGNLKQVIMQDNTILDSINAVMSGNWKAYHDMLYVAEFHYPLSAIGEVQILLSIVILVIYLLLYLWKRARLSLPFNLKLISLAIALVFMSYLFNILIKWLPSHNHEMPYLELIIAITIFAGISFSVRYIRIISLGMISLRFGYHLIYSSIQHNYHLADFFNVVVIIGVILIIYLANQFCQLDKRE